MGRRRVRQSHFLFGIILNDQVIIRRLHPIIGRGMRIIPLIKNTDSEIIEAADVLQEEKQLGVWQRVQLRQKFCPNLASL